MAGILKRTTKKEETTQRKSSQYLDNGPFQSLTEYQFTPIMGWDNMREIRKYF